MLGRWSQILGPDLAPKTLDGETVRGLALLAPKYSLHDYGTICDLVDDGQVFAGVTDGAQRRAIQDRLRDCDRILTVSSFFEDMIYARVCFDALHPLLSSSRRSEPALRLRDGFRHVFEGSPAAFGESYIAMWLYAMRNFPGLQTGKNGGVRVCTRNKGRKAISPQSPAAMAFVARSLGFRTDEIDRLIATGPANLRPETVSDDAPKVSSYRGNVCEHARSNRPCEVTYPSVADGLHPSHVFVTIEEPPGTFVTAFALARDTARCFWGNEYSRQMSDARTSPETGAGGASWRQQCEVPNEDMVSMVEALRSPLLYDSGGVLHDTDTRDHEDRSSPAGALIAAASTVRHTDFERDRAKPAIPTISIPIQDSYRDAMLYGQQDLPSVGSSVYSREPNEYPTPLALLEGCQPMWDRTTRPDPDEPRMGESLGHHDHQGEGLLGDLPVSDGRSEHSREPQTEDRFAEHRPSFTPSLAEGPTRGNTASRDMPQAQKSVSYEEQVTVGNSEPSADGTRQTDEMTRFLRRWGNGAEGPEPHRSPSARVATPFRHGNLAEGQERETLVAGDDALDRGDADQHGRRKRRASAAGLAPPEPTSRPTGRLTSFPGQFVESTVRQNPRAVGKSVWDAEDSLIRSVVAPSRKLSSNKVYVASMCDLGQPSRRDPNDRRLWRWREDERDAFMHALDPVPEDYCLKIVIQSNDYRERRCETISASECWDKLWQSRRSRSQLSTAYPFAVMVESATERSDKIMRTAMRR